jgi:hypothetical protein
MSKSHRPSGGQISDIQWQVTSVFPWGGIAPVIDFASLINPKQQHQPIEKPIGWRCQYRNDEEPISLTISPHYSATMNPTARVPNFYPNVSIYEKRRIGVKISVNKKAQDRCYFGSWANQTTLTYRGFLDQYTHHR